MSNIYTVYSSTLYMDMLFQFLNYCVKEDSSEKIVMKEPINKIDIKELSFSYNGKTKVLDKINLTLVQGEKVALVGPNGSGKSTFLKILAGLYNIEEGEILINGRSLKDLDIRSYRSKMSVLFQDFVKYELSLRENIGFGDIQNLNNDEKMVQMLHKLQTKFLQTDNGSYNLDLQLGNWFEDGCQLSQGQWQKIALGRVYFRDASFYILDALLAEALKALTERKRDVILLSYFMEMNDADIARKLNLVRSTVHEHRTRSLEILKAMLEENVNENGKKKCK